MGDGVLRGIQCLMDDHGEEEFRIWYHFDKKTLEEMTECFGGDSCKFYQWYKCRWCCILSDSMTKSEIRRVLKEQNNLFCMIKRVNWHG